MLLLIDLKLFFFVSSDEGGSKSSSDSLKERKLLNMSMIDFLDYRLFTFFSICFIRFI